jgi:hypothetical protein
MLSITFDDAHHAFILQPDGRITQDDIATLTERVDRHINEHDSIPSIVIHAPKFPGWKDFGALVKHMRFVRQHHTLVPKVAIVSDAAALSILPHLADHFVKAQIRHFRADHLDAAKAWVSDPDGPPGKIEWIDGLPRDVVAIRATGTITARDYEEELLPAIRQRLEEHDRLKLLYHLGDDFDGCTAGAIWDDAKFGLLHLSDFSRVAMVSDVDWIRHATKLFAPLLRGEVQLFSNDELEDAKHWIKA